MEFMELVSTEVEKVFKIVVEAEKIDIKVEEELRNIAATAAIQGFRPGKAPLTLIRKRYKDSVRSDALRNEMQAGVDSILKSLEARVASRPIIDDINDTGSKIEFTIKIETMPSIDLADLKNAKVTIPVVKISEEEIDKRMQEILDNTQEFEQDSSSEAVLKGDKVIIDFDGSVDGQKIEGGSSKEYGLIIGSGQFIPGFEDQIIGSKAGDDIVVKVTFPDEYQTQSLSGKDAEFKVKLHAVHKPKKLSMDDTFAQCVGYSDISDMRNKVSLEMSNAFFNGLYKITKMRLFDQLEQILTFPLPKSLIEAEMKSISDYGNELRSTSSDANKSEQSDNESFEMLNSDTELLRRIAMRRIRVGMVISEYAKTHNVTVNDADINKFMLHIIHDIPQEYLYQTLHRYRNDKKFANDVAQGALESKIIHTMLANDIIVTEENYSTDGIIKLIQEEDERDVL